MSYLIRALVPITKHSIQLIAYEDDGCLIILFLIYEEL